ncbi:transposase [Roseibium sp. ROS1]
MTDEQHPGQLETTGTSEHSDSKSTSQQSAGPGRISKSGKRSKTAKGSTGQRYTVKERAEKIAEIETRLSEGLNIKAAIKEAGISEQTYYRWKRNAAPKDKPEKPVLQQPKVEKMSGSELETLEDLVALEAENIRLRTQLAEKLRAENAELRKRLGME